jgi:hypothetical protein
MNNQSDPKLWERKTLASALVSAVLAGAVAASVCAVRGETLALPPVPVASLSGSHTDTLAGSV